jgi:single-stranded-DNA-specific exonuclease
MARLVGSSKEHVKLTLAQENSSEYQFPGIAFQQANHYHAIHNNEPFDICFAIEENHFRGKTTLQLNIKDIKQR